ncbi:MAG: hypothetical protein GXP49_16485, partial [Deltaproteobacteria bacterium]|nr:hypothetical protein [Deltaproteobacteria bacterium]
ALSMSYRGTLKKVGPPFDEPSDKCIGCGACAFVCPTNCIKVIDSAQGREIPRWGVNFEWQRCKRCGKPVGTKEQVARLKEQNPQLAEDLFDLCIDCRRQDYALRVASEGHV